MMFVSVDLGGRDVVLWCSRVEYVRQLATHTKY